MSFFKRIFGRRSSALYREGIEAYNAGRWEEALAAFRRAIAAGGSSSDPFIGLSRFYAAEASTQLARAALEAGQPAQALRLLEAARRWNRRDTHVLFLAALARAELGAGDEALRLLDELATENPQHVHAQILAAALLFAHDRRADALLCIERVRRDGRADTLSPGSARVLTGLSAGFPELETLLRDYLPTRTTRRA